MTQLGVRGELLKCARRPNYGARHGFVEFRSTKATTPNDQLPSAFELFNHNCWLDQAVRHMQDSRSFRWWQASRLDGNSGIAAFDRKIPNGSLSESIREIFYTGTRGTRHTKYKDVNVSTFGGSHRADNDCLKALLSISIPPTCQQSIYVGLGPALKLCIFDPRRSKLGGT